MYKRKTYTVDSQSAELVVLTLARKVRLLRYGSPVAARGESSGFASGLLFLLGRPCRMVIREPGDSVVVCWITFRTAKGILLSQLFSRVKERSRQNRLMSALRSAYQ